MLAPFVASHVVEACCLLRIDTFTFGSVDPATRAQRTTDSPFARSTPLLQARHGRLPTWHSTRASAAAGCARQPDHGHHLHRRDSSRLFRALHSRCSTSSTCCGRRARLDEAWFSVAQRGAMWRRYNWPWRRRSRTRRRNNCCVLRHSRVKLLRADGGTYDSCRASSGSPPLRCASKSVACVGCWVWRIRLQWLEPSGHAFWSGHTPTYGKGSNPETDTIRNCGVQDDYYSMMTSR